MSKTYHNTFPAKWNSNMKQDGIFCLRYFLRRFSTSSYTIVSPLYCSKGSPHSILYFANTPYPKISSNSKNQYIYRSGVCYLRNIHSEHFLKKIN